MKASAFQIARSEVGVVVWIGKYNNPEGHILQKRPSKKWCKDSGSAGLDR